MGQCGPMGGAHGGLGVGRASGHAQAPICPPPHGRPPSYGAQGPIGPQKLVPQRLVPTYLSGWSGQRDKIEAAVFIKSDFFEHREKIGGCFGGRYFQKIHRSIDPDDVFYFQKFDFSKFTFSLFLYFWVVFRRSGA